MVSILTPCYNSEKYIFRLLNSIINQTYPNIEMFVIDDGSTDNSAEIIKSYIPKFETKGYKLSYIYQENSGQSVAINNGLKLIQGKYLVWPDSDDFYADNNAIEMMVNALKNSDASVSMVRCFSNLLDENTLEIIGYYKTNKKNKGKKNLFEDCLFGQNGFWFGAGVYMAKVETINQKIPNREIYTAKNAGQNWQLMLPLLYKQKCLTIEDALYNIVVRKSSHSRGMYSTMDAVLSKYLAYENTIISTLNTMDMSPEKRHQYLKKIQEKYNLIKLDTYLKFNNHKQAKKLINNQPNHNMMIRYRLSLFPYNLGNILWKIYRKLFVK